MRVQIELTTRCNFDCFYCAGRDMPQGDMPYAHCMQILEQHVPRYGVPQQVWLQGEGEPTLHAQFFELAAAVRALGSTPYTITNGTHKHPEKFIEHFDVLGVSVDTLDEPTAKKIGRHNLARVIDFIDAVRGGLRVNIHTVAIAADLPRIRQFCAQRGLRHVVQPLQPKPDYSYRYPQLPKITRTRSGRFSCSYLSQPRMRYYALDGSELPCCFIKDTSAYQGLAAIHEIAGRGETPPQCEGCVHGQQG